MQKESRKARSTCAMCGQRPVAINCYYGKKVYYRKICDTCGRARAAGQILKPQPPSWVKSGYKKKDRCEVCGFKAKTMNQLTVYHLDGNLKNNQWLNLKTVCANCAIDVQNTGLSWKASPITPDF